MYIYFTFLFILSNKRSLGEYKRIAVSFLCFAFNNLDQSAQKLTKGYIVLDLNGDLISAGQRDAVTPQRLGRLHGDRVTVWFRLWNFILAIAKENINFITSTNTPYLSTVGLSEY